MKRREKRRDTAGKEGHLPGDEGETAEQGVAEDHKYHKGAAANEDVGNVVTGAETSRKEKAEPRTEGEKEPEAAEKIW